MAEAVGRRVPSQTLGPSPSMPSIIHSGDPTALEVALAVPENLSTEPLGSTKPSPSTGNGCRGLSREERSVHSPGSTHLSGAP